MPGYDASIRVNTKVDNSDLGKLQKEFDKLEAKLDSLYRKGDKLEALGVDKQSKQWKALTYDVAQTEIALEDVRESIQAVSKLNLSTTESGFEKVEKSSQKCFKLIQSGAQKSNGLLATLSSRLKGIALSLLVFNWITKGFNAMVQAMKVGFQNLAQYSNEYNDSISNLKSQSAQLKNGLAAAFEPIANLAIPYLIQMVAWLNNATDSIGQFFAALQGKSTYTKAKEQVIDYAKALNVASKSAKGMLASFDNLNVLENKEDSAGGIEEEGANAFETANVNKDIAKMAESIRKFITVLKPYVNGFAEGFVGFFQDLGESLSPEFISAFEELTEILSEGDPEKAKEWGEAIASLSFVLIAFKGLEKVVDFLGKVGTGFKTLAGIIPGVLGLLTMNPGMAGELGLALDKLLEGTFLDPDSWTGKPKEIYDTVNDAIGKCIDTVGDALGTFFITIGEKLLNYDDAGTWFAAAGEWFSRISEDFNEQDWLGIGEDIIKGIGNGLVGGLVGLVEPIADLFAWTWDEICKVFGIHSPAKEMEPIGENILLGIVEGFSGEIEEFEQTISDWFDNSVKPWFTREKWENAMEGIKEAFSSTFKGAANAAISKMNQFIDYVNEKLNFEWDSFNFLGKEIWPSGGFSLAQIPNIPYLANGAVIQGGRPFAAILGDQRFGQTNIETPLPTMLEAFKQANAEMGMNKGYSGPVYLQIDGKTFAKLELPYFQGEEQRIGLSLKVT